MSDTKIIQPGQEVTLDPNLPPPGQARREVLAERTDNLQEEAERLSQEGDLTSIPHDHDVLRPDREIQRDIGEGHLKVYSAQIGYMYKWENFVNYHGSLIYQAKAAGWEVVQSADPENRDNISADGTRKVGDVLLMRMPMDKHLIMTKKEEEIRRRQQFGVEAEIFDLADRNPRAFAGVSIGEAGGDIRHEGASKAAMNHLGKKLKKGTVPGLAIR